MNYTPTTCPGNCFQDENNPAVLRVEDEDNDHGASSLSLGLCVTLAVSMIEDILSFFLFLGFKGDWKRTTFTTGPIDMKGKNLFFR